MAEGRSLEYQVILGGGRHCSVWGVYVNMYGGGHTVLGCEKTTVISGPSLPVEMGLLIAILQISCNTINLNLTCISNYFRFLILFFIIHVV